MRVLLVDDHPLFRQAFASLLATAPDFQVVGEAGDGREAIAQAVALAPDIIVMDLSMPVMDGLEATRQLRQVLPAVRIVILTISDDDEKVFEAIKSGAQGYLLKKIDGRAVFDSLRSVMAGEACFSRRMASKIIAEFVRRAQTPAAPPPSSRLTAREREVLELVSLGKSNKEIASALSLAESTVKNHMNSILAKLHLENRAQAAQFFPRQTLS